MADLISQERLFPSLLDRLCDDDTARKIESRDVRGFSLHKLREAVLRDLSWLLNTCSFAVVQDLDPYPFVKSSVINYGIPDLTGKTVSGLDVIDIQRALRQAILDFEPRIIPKSLEVRALLSKHRSAGNSLAFEIEGDLWSRPLPERLYLRTELDLETGSVTVVKG